MQRVDEIRITSILKNKPSELYSKLYFSSYYSHIIFDTQNVVLLVKNIAFLILLELFNLVNVVGIELDNGSLEMTLDFAHDLKYFKNQIKI